MRRRGLADRLQRGLITRLLPHPGRFRRALHLARWTRPLAGLLPRRFRHLAAMAPRRLPAPAEVALPGVHAARGPVRLRAALLTGCAQSVLGPAINDAAVRLLTRIGVEVVIPG